MLRIRDVYPGSDFFPSGIPDPHQRISVFCGSFLPFKQIQPTKIDSDPSEFRIRNNDFNHGTDPYPSIIAQKEQDKLFVNGMDPDPYNKQTYLKLEKKTCFQLFDHVQKTAGYRSINKWYGSMEAPSPNP
jgi:hypothetical protein